MTNKLDVAFAMDTTSSMRSYIASAKENIESVIQKIKSIGITDICLAFVEYRDHPPQEASFVTKKNDFTSSIITMKKWLSDCKEQGGGDTPEAVADALNDVLNLSWRETAKKMVFLIADAPPHGLVADVTFDKIPECPAGFDPVKICHQLASKGVILYVIGCEPSLDKYKDFFISIACITGGQYVPLSNAQHLAEAVLAGVQEEMSLQKLVSEVDEEINRDIANGIEIDEEEISKRVHEKLKSKGARAKQLKTNPLQVGEIRKYSKQMSKLKSLKEMREFRSNPSRSGELTSSLFTREAEEIEISEDEVTEEQAERMVRRAASRRHPRST